MLMILVYVEFVEPQLNKALDWIYLYWLIDQYSLIKALDWMYNQSNLYYSLPLLTNNWSIFINKFSMLKQT